MEEAWSVHVLYLIVELIEFRGVAGVIVVGQKSLRPPPSAN